MESAIPRFTAYFTGGSRARQLALAGGVAALLFGAMAAIYFATRPSYQVLFRDLKPQDAAAIVAELDKEKVPYRIDARTSAILVPEGDTRATRLKLMSTELRLQGVVGFELFNNSDLGLTEFTQKVNYQRALQGELARTIMTLEEIDLARVHLTLPESSIFRRDAARPKASVALFMRDGQSLSSDTIRGIQRLVAAAVPELSPGDVTVVDQKGDLASARGTDVDDPQFALKQAIERRYEQKILTQIAPIIGANRASVSVDANLNFDQVRTTRESDVSQPIVNADGKAATVVPLPVSPGKPGALPIGPPPLPALSSNDGTRTDRHLEQIVKSPGSIRRLSVGIVLDKNLPPEEMARMNAVVSASIGLDPARGDVLSTFVRTTSKDTVEHPSVQMNGVALPVPTDAHSVGKGSTTQTAAVWRQRGTLREWHDSIRRTLNAIGLTGVSIRIVSAWIFGTLMAVLLIAIVMVKASRRRRHAPIRQLTDTQREAYVTRLRALLAQRGDTDGQR
ncbi:flagellar basal-body MS-ring/collar protein FliF [Burkholderia cepacia]|uniref:Flagellar M-ring protein n=1 Tax=Burkholderia cepacia TaxID=292 RepID=A0AA88Z4Y9_BURCE|nr:flagellar basal-body MS-ring/collar protein FliF [Burkholderia cepacia]KGB99093.1 flagellar M-ring protein FliF [Burkholderia cepacia]